MHHLWPWERATVPEQDLDPVALPAYVTPDITTLIFGLAAFLPILLSGNILLLPPLLLLARACALDLHYRILPDIYLLPTGIYGILYALWSGTLGITLILALSVIIVIAAVIFASRMLNPKAVFGGGDLKLILVLFLLYGQNAAILLLLMWGCYLLVRVAMNRPEEFPFPFGALAYPVLMIWLILIHIPY